MVKWIIGLLMLLLVAGGLLGWVTRQQVGVPQPRLSRCAAVCDREGIGRSGTGSYPMPPQGWQRSNRRRVSQLPKKGP